jgi:Peptidylarginine deiminase and related enzymes
MRDSRKGLRMPAEWEKHERTLISWPVRETMCFPEDYERVCAGYAAFARAVSEFEPVTVIVSPGEAEQVRQRFDTQAIRLLPVPHNDSWIRDNGPTFLVDERRRRAGINWHFNAWGEKYPDWDLDDQVAPLLLDHFQTPRIDAPLVLEGGSIHVDGAGTLLTTEQCLLHPNRNPQLSRVQIEQELKHLLHIRKIVWLKRGLSGDETDGHVDNMACFAAPGKVLLQTCDDPDDPNYRMTKENLEILSKTKDAGGRNIEVIPIPQPPERTYKGNRLTLSYLNFYLVNGGVILPVFGGDAAQTDKLAEERIGAAFPDRRIRTVNGMAVITEGGNVHCATQQMPALQGGEEA